MSGTKIKICGIKEPEHAIAAAKAGAKWIGLVFVEKSPRFVSIEQAKAVIESLPDAVTPVGLFADHRAEEIIRIADAIGLSTIQLHGREPHRILDKLDELQVIRAFAYQGKDFKQYIDWDTDDRVKLMLLDSPPTGQLTGGSGHAFNWQELADMRTSFYKPYLLAGGLTPDNVGEAIRTVRPYAVDVSSGVESSRGVKDVGLIKAFCEEVRIADQSLSRANESDFAQ